MDLIEDIGPILGIVAFLGFAILALLIVLQAREVRRLREWAGRAPERAGEADEALQAVVEARGEAPDEETPGTLTAARERLAASWGHRWAALDSRSPFDPRWFLAVLLVALLAVGIPTSGFGLLGGDDPPPAEESGPAGGAGKQREREPKPTAAVLNATQIDDPIAPVGAVSGIADVVAEDVVRPAGFRVVERANAPGGEERTVIMFEPDAEEAATELAAAIEPDLGATETEPILDEISALAGGADVVLLVGQDDAEFGSGDAAPVGP